MNILSKIIGEKYPWYEIYKSEGINKKPKFFDGSMYEKIVDTKNKYPENIAYSYYGNNVTYTSLVSKINELSRALIAEGVKPKDVVSISSVNIPEAIITFFAVNKIGAIANMLHPLSSKNEFKNYFEMSNTKYLFVLDMVFDNIKDVILESNIKKTILYNVSSSMNALTTFGYWLTKGRKTKKHVSDFLFVNYEDFKKQGNSLNNSKPYKFNKNDVAVILYSGGTTGKCKGIMHSNYAFNSVAASELEICKDLQEGVSVLSAMPIFHGFGLASTIYAPLYVGGKCIFLPTFSAKKFGDIIKKYTPNIIAGVPTLYEGMLSSKSLKRFDLSFLKCAICGGDTLTKNLKEKIDDFFYDHNALITIRASFGLTESISGVTMMPRVLYVSDGIGIPCPGYQVKIVSPQTHTLAQEMEEGEICISGPSVMLGYLNETSETLAVLRKHDDGKMWLHTGDLGYMDEHGYVYFEQRIKRIIISSGYNIYPNQIEKVLLMHPDVLSCVVIGIPHPYKVQVAKAYIVLKDGVNETFKVKKELKELVKENIAQYAYPYEYEFIKDLPKTKLGKVAYNELNKDKEDEEGKA